MIIHKLIKLSSSTYNITLPTLLIPGAWPTNCVHNRTADFLLNELIPFLIPTHWLLITLILPESIWYLEDCLRSRIQRQCRHRSHNIFYQEGSRWIGLEDFLRSMRPHGIGQNGWCGRDMQVWSCPEIPTAQNHLWRWHLKQKIDIELVFCYQSLNNPFCWNMLWLSVHTYHYIVCLLMSDSPRSRSVLSGLRSHL